MMRFMRSYIQVDVWFVQQVQDEAYTWPFNLSEALKIHQSLTKYTNHFSWNKQRSKHRSVSYMTDTSESMIF